MMLRWRGVVYTPGVTIPEELYEDYIDRAYGRGMGLRDTLIWNDRFERGFASPDDEGGWYAFAFDGSRYVYLGQFTTEQLVPEGADWDDHEYEMLLKADTSIPRDAIPILRELFLDSRSGEHPNATELAIANDDECIQWMIDYWTFVRWNERGNECMISEVGFRGFIDTILHPSEVSEYLKEADCDSAKDLDRRLSRLCKRYGRSR